MSETNMPAAEATAAPAIENDELMSYEFAFHVLPTVAEGEVAEVYSGLKTLIEKSNGEIFDEEAPKRFDLAYEIVKHLEGKNRKFSSAYFGWVRFKAAPGDLEAFSAEVDAHKDLLRYLIIKLTKVEEAHPFRFHEALEVAKVSTIEDEAVVEASAPEKKTDADDEEKAEVDDSELDEALKKEEA